MGPVEGVNCDRRSVYRLEALDPFFSSAPIEQKMS